MRTVNISEAKSGLSRLVEAVESGAETEIVIARNGRPAARLVPIKKAVRPVQRIGVIKVAGDIPPDDASMSGMIADMFELSKQRRAKKAKRDPVLARQRDGDPVFLPRSHEAHEGFMKILTR